MQVEFNDENKPLVGNGNGNGSNGHDSLLRRTEQRCWTCRYQFLGLVLVVIAAAFFLPGQEEEVINVFDNPKAPEDPATQTPPVMYRPFCLTHGGEASARILQTSMGAPSQQWAHIPCYSQPEKVRRWAPNRDVEVNLNKYGAPDAIIQTQLSKPAFTNRTPILGFGAAFTEAASLNYQSLDENGKQKLMELFYGKSGLGYSLGRVHINSCDFSVQSYSFDETDGDFKLEDFDMDVAHDSQKDGMIDMIKRATTVFNSEWKSPDGIDGDFKTYASPWSPPAWMKAPRPEDEKGAIHADGMTGSAQPSCLRDGTGPGSKYADAWALYFSKFITACKIYELGAYLFSFLQPI
jgi:hypothetical protein